MEHQRHLIYVHGIGNKVEPVALKRQWDIDLFGHEMGDQTRMVYWADLRYDEPLPSEMTQRIYEQGLPLHTGGASTLGLPMESMESTELDGVSEAAELEKGVFVDYLSYAEGVRSAISAEYGPEVLGPLGDRLLPEILRRFVKDAGAYFFGPERELIRNRLREALREVRGAFVVIGHSLGAIITYDVLSESAFDGLEVTQYITIGTQLGVGEIQRRVHQPLQVPAPVARWHNFYDPWDLSPMAQSLSDEFAPRGTIHDIEVDNLSTSNHSSGGYLRTPQVRNLFPHEI